MSLCCPVCEGDWKHCSTNGCEETDTNVPLNTYYNFKTEMEAKIHQESFHKCLFVVNSNSGGWHVYWVGMKDKSKATPNENCNINFNLNRYDWI